VEKVCEITVKGDLPQADNDADAWQSLDLGSKMTGAVADLRGERLVARRGAAYYRGDPSMAKPQTIVAADGVRFGGKTKVVQDGIHEVAGSVAGEGATGAVGTVCTGSEAKDEDAGTVIAKARDGTGPVGVFEVSAAFGLADSAAVVAQAGAAFAFCDGFTNLQKKWRRTVCRGSHCI
jgi:hypothetical protein